MLTVCESVPLLPSTVSLKVPFGVDALVRTDSVDDVTAGFGENVAVAPAGTPPKVRPTDPVNPFRAPIVTPYVAVPPPDTVTESGTTEIEKSGAGVVGAQSKSASKPPDGYWARETSPPVNPAPAQFDVAPVSLEAPATQLGSPAKDLVPPVMTPHW